MFEPVGTRSEQITAIGDELRILSEGFRTWITWSDSMNACFLRCLLMNPLTESIAGAALDAKTAVRIGRSGGRCSRRFRSRWHACALTSRGSRQNRQRTVPVATASQDSRKGSE
jgi:hypothetical protein